MREVIFAFARPRLFAKLATMKSARPPRARNNRYVLGIDFGTLSARALLVDVATGREVGTAVAGLIGG